MKRLTYEKHSGLQIVCQGCNHTIHTNMKSYKGCKHPFEKQYYKLVLPNPKTGGRLTKKLTTQNINEALAALVQFKNEVCNPFQLNITKSIKPMLLVDCIVIYLDFKNNVDVPHHKQRQLSTNYIDGIERFIRKFTKFLVENGVNIKLFKVNDVTEEIVGNYYKYLTDLKFSGVTFNHFILHMKMFYEYLINKKGYKIENPFKDIKRKVVISQTVSVFGKDFYELLDIITPEDSKQVVGKRAENKDRYRPWLKDFFRLSAFTGRRRTELTLMKWNWIEYDESGIPIYIKSPDVKVNHLQANLDENNWKIIFVPIIHELKELLLDLGFNEKQGSNEYIIAPDESMSRVIIEDFASKSFTFYFKKLNRKYIRSLKHLRKTYATKLKIFSSGIEQDITQHSSIELMNNHYIDHKDVATKVARSDFRVFEPRIIEITA